MSGGFWEASDEDTVTLIAPALILICLASAGREYYPCPIVVLTVIADQGDV
jgi:hypothetical protein